MEVTIKKATVVNSMFLKYAFKRTDLNVNDTVNTNSDQVMHDDLKQAFKAFIPHFCFICELIKDEKLIKKAIQDPENYLSDLENVLDTSFLKYSVTDFNINEKKDGDIILTLTGYKKLESGESITIKTPDISMLDDEYKFFDELNNTLEVAKSEVMAYMQGKCAPVIKTQTEMFGEDDEEIDVELEVVTSDDDAA